MRSTFLQLRLSRFPSALGLCQSDIPQIAAYGNEATYRLLNVFGEQGPYGCWDRVAFQTTSLTNPYLTLPPQYSRAIGFDVCRFPLRIENPFYEVLDAGIGLRGPNNCVDRCGPREAYDRGNFSTMVDLTPTNQFLRVYPTNQADVDAQKTVLISGALDQNGNGIYSQVGSQQVNGVLLTLQFPFTTSPMIISSFSKIGKDVTAGDVVLTQVDATSGTEVTLSRYTPRETGPAYRRYYFSALPTSCCPPVTPGNLSVPVTITAMAKLEFVPMAVDTDFLLIGNISALTEEALSLKYSGMESSSAMALEDRHHRKAVKLLNQELDHYLGRLMPAINFAPWGTSTLERAGIGVII